MSHYLVRHERKKCKMKNSKMTDQKSADEKLNAKIRRTKNIILSMQKTCKQLYNRPYININQSRYIEYYINIDISYIRLCQGLATTGGTTQGPINRTTRQQTKAGSKAL